ncbi:MAG: hypothetical protein ACP5KW_06550 [Thermoproteota archaeon]
MDVDQKILAELGGSLLKEVDVGVYSDKHVDRVVVRSDAVYIIEVENELNYTAVGQALAYSVLYKQKYSERREVRPAIACSKIDLDLKFVCEKLGIKLIKL